MPLTQERRIALSFLMSFVSGPRTGLDDIIESKTVHDFKFCSCGSCAVDGGHDYLRRCGNLGDWEELSEVEKVEDNGALT